MSESLTFSGPRSIQLQSSAVPRGATDCTARHCAVARALWPHKTAEHWAHAAGVQTRMAKYWLAGHELSGAGKLALIRALL